MTIEEKVKRFTEAKTKLIKLLDLSYVNNETGEAFLCEGTSEAMVEFLTLLFDCFEEYYSNDHPGENH